MNSDSLSLLLAPAILRSRNNDALEFTIMLQNKKKNVHQVHPPNSQNSASSVPTSSSSSSSAPSTPTPVQAGISITTSPIENTKEGHPPQNQTQPAGRAGLSAEDAQRLAQLVKQEQETVAHSKQLVIFLSQLPSMASSILPFLDNSLNMSRLITRQLIRISLIINQVRLLSL